MSFENPDRAKTSEKRGFKESKIKLNDKFTAYFIQATTKSLPTPSVKFVRMELVATGVSTDGNIVFAAMPGGRWGDSFCRKNS